MYQERRTPKTINVETLFKVVIYFYKEGLHLIECIDV